MSNREGEKPTLKWIRKKEWGSEGMTHRTTAELPDGRTLSFCVLSPVRGEWHAQAWLGMDPVMFRHVRTLAGAKAECQIEYDLAVIQTRMAKGN